MGTEAFWVPAAVAALGSGAQYVNQKQASQRQNDAQIEAIQHAQALEGTARAQTNQLTQQIARNTPTQIANKATGEYVDQLRKGAAGSTQGGSTTDGTQTSGQSTSALAPAVGASSRYKEDAANSQKEVANYGNTYAQEMGNLDAATRQRQNEALGMQTLGTNFNTLGAQSYSTNFVDQLRAQAAGQANPWVALMGNLLKNGASAYAMNAGGGVSPYAKIGKGGRDSLGNMLDAGNGLSGAAAGLA